MRLALLILSFILANHSLAQGPPAPAMSFEIAFWAGPNADSDPRVVTIYEHHACGSKVAVARVTSMPRHSVDATLQPELAVELSPVDKVIQRWSLPVDGVIAAVSGDELIVPIASARAGEQALGISAGGKLRLISAPESTDFGTLVQCPQVPQFETSAYVRCFQFTDLASGETRRIAYEGACT